MIVTRADLANPAFLVCSAVREGDKCLVCDGPVRVPFVMWHGVISEFVLHPECARRLGANLIDDGTRAEGGEPEHTA